MGLFQHYVLFCKKAPIEYILILVITPKRNKYNFEEKKEIMGKWQWGCLGTNERVCRIKHKIIHSMLMTNVMANA